MQEARDVFPTSFLLDDQQRRLILSWSDGHEGIYSWERLRRACPCAICAGEGGAPGRLQRRQHLTTEETTLVNLEPVGRYGLTPIWEDGHRTGIFTFEKLRQLCECPQCRASDK
ncbi:DUF971 domain-containing protein [Thermogemmatispora sp.]|uniref:DUF971 domain-containing protein n=1 Tax=Thermogemmatispora sp. TaxID=1968838 RepID=UPI001D5AB0F4|nr:DUF971 domain-containing protein [Thermogemmatispora sp.]MBX5448653.1 DUF971 domain-containing protein [Thermogemmatispora sp.]